MKIKDIFKDENLAKVISKALGQGSNINYEVSNEELESITDLEAYNKSIQDLTGIDKLTKARWVDLSNNQIIDLSPLSGLTVSEDFIYLNLSGNEITDVSPLSGLTNLKLINLSGNLITDISPLNALLSEKNLEYLYLFNQYLYFTETFNDNLEFENPLKNLNGTFSIEPTNISNSGTYTAGNGTIKGIVNWSNLTSNTTFVTYDFAVPTGLEDCYFTGKFTIKRG